MIRGRSVVLIWLLATVTAGAQEPSLGLCDRPVLALDPGMHIAPIVSADVDAAGRFAVTGSDDHTVRVWDLAEARLVETLRMPVGPGNVGKVYAVAISPQWRDHRGVRLDAVGAKRTAGADLPVRPGDGDDDRSPRRTAERGL